ncbi:MAG: PilZ domain-containing protein [Bryobacteraceae bacterium]|nr:PilZ domain-containing protein [Bryobacteraceae bacterium]
MLESNSFMEMVTLPRTERRSASRFPIERNLRVRVVSRKGDVGPCRGQTINMSSTGILFTSDCDLTPGRRVELAISWPAQLNDHCPLKLVARGRVVRVDKGKAAIEIQQYEFRTAGSNGFQD